uniref:Uncharacterized protein n=1 Tax=Oncorhynchus tshawytscha TaxID=74940 RepID=A0AAZ3PMG1_ONCTS
PNERILCSRGTSGSSFPVAGLIRASVSASHEMGRIISAGQRYGVDPAVLSGIVSRESRGWDRTGQSLRLTMEMPIWANAGGGAWDSREHVDQRHPHLTKEQKLKSYNMGAGSISSYEQVDAKTTGGNYANDVVARAEYLKKTCYLILFYGLLL